jgi:hypothetical protein
LSSALAAQAELRGWRANVSSNAMDSPEDRAKRRVDDQRSVVRKLRKEGQDSRTAERLLATFLEILRALRR